MVVQISTDQMIAVTLAVLATSARSARRNACYVCAQAGIFDRTARHPAAAVRVGICREPYVLDICERHLGPLRQTLPAGGLWIMRISGQRLAKGPVRPGTSISRAGHQTGSDLTICQQAVPRSTGQILANDFLARAIRLVPCQRCRV